MTRINSGFDSLPIENLEAPTGNQVATKQLASQAPVQNEVAGLTTTSSELAPAPLTDPLTKNFIQEQLAAADKTKGTQVSDEGPEESLVSEELPKESLVSDEGPKESVALNFTKIATV
jgi:hypothetical protein